MIVMPNVVKVLPWLCLFALARRADAFSVARSPETHPAETSNVHPKESFQFSSKTKQALQPRLAALSQPPHVHPPQQQQHQKIPSVQENTLMSEYEKQLELMSAEWDQNQAN